MLHLDGHSALPKEKLLQGRSREQRHACVLVQYSHCCVHLHSCSHLVLLTPLFLQKCLDFPLRCPTSPLTPCSVLTLLTLFFPSLLLSKLPGPLYRPRSLLWGPEPCVGWWGHVKGRRKRAAFWKGHRQLGCGGERQWEIEQSFQGALERGVPHPSPSSFGELLLQPSLGRNSYTGFPFLGKRQRSQTFPAWRLYFML